MIVEMEQGFGGAPYVSELVEVIGLVMLGSDDRLVLSVVPSSLIVVPSTRESTERISRVEQLSDSAFVLASRFISVLLDENARSGRVLTETEFSSYLIDVLVQVPASLLADSAADVRAIELLGSPVRKRPKRGDVVAIPSVKGGFHLAVVLAKNRFGTALGLFVERRVVAKVPKGLDRASAISHAVYTDERSILSGRWMVVGHDDSLCSFFPHDPEIYHALGIAETASGATRTVSDEELDRIGMFDGSYSQAYVSSDLEHELDSGGLLRVR